MLDLQRESVRTVYEDRRRPVEKNKRACYNRCMSVSALTVLLFSSASLLAMPAGSVALPPIAHADTETVTNVPFTASLDAAGRGLEGHGEFFAVQVLPDAVVIRFR